MEVTSFLSGPETLNNTVFGELSVIQHCCVTNCGGELGDDARKVARSLLMGGLALDASGVWMSFERI